MAPFAIALADVRDSFAFAAQPRSGSIVTLARDDGRYADEPLQAWFYRLGSGKWLCCSFADGRAIPRRAAYERIASDWAAVEYL